MMQPKAQPGSDKIKIWLKKQYVDLPAKAAVFFGIVFVWILSVIIVSLDDVAGAYSMWSLLTPPIIVVALIRALRTERTDGVTWYLNTVMFYVLPVAVIPLGGVALVAIPLFLIAGLAELRNAVRFGLYVLNNLLTSVDRGGK